MALKEHAAQIRRVSDKVELNEPAPKMISSSQ
jgi:hypothetical protein